MLQSSESQLSTTPFSLSEFSGLLEDGLIGFGPDERLCFHNAMALTLFQEAGETLDPDMKLLSIMSLLERICYADPLQSTDLSQLTKCSSLKHLQRQVSLKSGRRLSIFFLRAPSGNALLILRDVSENWSLQLKLDNSLNAAITTLAELAEYRDTDTGEHVLRVARLSYELARFMSKLPGGSEAVDGQTLQFIGNASKLHDIGKVGIPDSILLKPGKLDSEERLIMDKHAVLGGETLRKASELLGGDFGFRVASEIAFCHHERWDGGGYPFALRGTDIPLSARIVAVADVYDALSSRRPYKAPWPRDQVMAYLRENAGSQFDPAIIDSLFAVIHARDELEEVQWNPDMASGCDDIDADHKELLVLLNQMQSPENRDDRIATGYVLDELIGYSISHFAREERLMAHARYPGLTGHIAIHNRMRSELIHLSQKLKYSFTPELGEEVASYLKNWLTTHILEEDKAYFPIMNELAEDRLCATSRSPSNASSSP